MIKGRCGEDATYEFNRKTGKLVISGTGAIEVCAFDANAKKGRAFVSDIKTVVIEDGITEIGRFVFDSCINLTSIMIPNSVTNIEYRAFSSCTSLIDITIPDSVMNIGKYAFQDCTNLKTKKRAYKAFDLINNNIYCKDYTYTENEWSKTLDDIEPCCWGYHYCDNLFNIFNYYYEVIDRDIAIYECEVGDIVVPHDDKIVTNKIKPVKRLYREDVIRILNGEE